MANSFLSENDQILDSLGKVPSSEIEAAYLIHEELSLRIGPSILACPAPIELQTADNLFVPQEASSCDLRLQTILFGQLFLVELSQLAIPRNGVISMFRKNFLSSEREFCTTNESQLDFLLF